MAATCPKCGGRMEHGFTTAAGLIGLAAHTGTTSQLLFVVPGTPTSPNPISAFKQGLAGETADNVYRINGARCSACGFLEFDASERATGL